MQHMSERIVSVESSIRARTAPAHESSQGASRMSVAALLNQATGEFQPSDPFVCSSRGVDE